MILETTILKIDVLLVNKVNITYNLISDGRYFGIECYKEGASCENPREYSSVLQITKNREKAEKILQTIIEKDVFPVHLKDVLQDYFEV